MGGTLSVQSLMGVGSIFTLRLPLRLGEAPKGESTDLRGIRVLVVDDVEINQRVLLERAHAIAARETPGEGRIRALVAEDNPVNQKVAAPMLQRLACRVALASNGLEAVEMAARFPFDIVFMDCQMPEMDGLEATAAIRASENGGPRTPIVAMTAHVLTGDRERCLAAGMDDYIGKPVTPAELARVLNRWLGGSAAATG